MRFFFSDVLTYCVMLQALICYCSFVRCFWHARARARVCVCVCVCVCVVHWHCTAQLSMFNMEKRFRNKIIIIIIICLVQCETCSSVQCGYNVRSMDIVHSDCDDMGHCNDAANDLKDIDKSVYCDNNDDNSNRKQHQP